MAEITLKDLSVCFGSFTAVDKVNLTVQDKEFVVYLGPSGCGKTTTLRSIAGLVDATQGDILFDGTRVNAKAPSERNIAMVFQFVSLYPHMKISENIKFPLKARGVPAAQIKKKLDWVVDIFNLGDDLNRYPSALPPGTTQKVALARAVIRDPAVLLLDEPLSAIDEQFREEMRWELGHLQRELGVTTIYVTHDQREAMSLADRIVLMNDSKIVQVDKPHDLFFKPRTVFAGQFIGSPSMNLIDLHAVESGLRLTGSDLVLSRDVLPDQILSMAAELKLGIRPRNVKLIDNDSSGSFQTTINDVYSVGRERYFNFRVGEQIVQGMDCRNTISNGHARVVFDPDGMVFFDKNSGQRIDHGEYKK